MQLVKLYVAKGAIKINSSDEYYKIHFSASVSFSALINAFVNLPGMETCCTLNHSQLNAA